MDSLLILNLFFCYRFYTRNQLRKQNVNQVRKIIFGFPDFLGLLKSLHWIENCRSFDREGTSFYGEFDLCPINRVWRKKIAINRMLAIHTSTNFYLEARSEIVLEACDLPREMRHPKSPCDLPGHEIPDWFVELNARFASSNPFNGTDFKLLPTLLFIASIYLKPSLKVPLNWQILALTVKLLIDKKFHLTVFYFFFDFQFTIEYKKLMEKNIPENKFSRGILNSSFFCTKIIEFYSRFYF